MHKPPAGQPLRQCVNGHWAGQVELGGRGHGCIVGAHMHSNASVKDLSLGAGEGFP